MEESSSEEELPLLRSQRSLNLDVSSTSAEALAEISIERTREQRKIQLRNLVAVSGVALLLGSGLPAQYTVTDVLFTSPTNIRETTFSIHASFLGAFILGGFLFTPTLIAYLGLTKVLIFDCVAICIYLYISFVPSLYTLIPLGVIAGQALQSAYTAYLLILTQVTHVYLSTHIAHQGQARENVFHFFSGLFHTCFLAVPFIRTVCEVVFLQKETQKDISENDSMQCARLYCSWKADEVVLHDPDYLDWMLPNFNLRRLQALLSILSILAVGALFVLSLCIKTTHHLESQNVFKTIQMFAGSTWKMCRIDFLLLLPTMIFIGMEESVAFQVISKNYVSCQHGWMKREFFVLCVSGVATASCLPLAMLSAYVGRVKCTIMAHFILVSLLITLCVWTPDWDDMPFMFVIGSLWGLGNAVLRTQVLMMLEVVFQRHCVSAASLSNCFMGLGMLLVLLLQHYLCTQVSFICSLVISVTSTVTYIVYEIRQALNAKYGHLEEAKSELTLPDLDNPSWLPTLDPHTKRTRTSLIGKQ